MICGFSKKLTEEQAKLAEILHRDKAALEKSEKMMLITVCDRGDQEQFLMTHATLMADNSQHSATAYMIVMDGTKSLADAILHCSDQNKEASSWSCHVLALQ